MGLIIDDHGLGIHGELRRESFSLFSDFAKEWDVELPIEKLDEVFFVLQSLRLARNSGKHYAEHHRFTTPEPPDGKGCSLCRYLRVGDKTDHEARHIHEALDTMRLEGIHLAIHRMREWVKGETPARAKLLLLMCNDLACSFDFEHALTKKPLNDVQKAARSIEMDALLRAAAEMCAGCAKFSNEHACNALPIRRMIARIDPDIRPISPKEWMAKSPAAEL